VRRTLAAVGWPRALLVGALAGLIVLGGYLYTRSTSGTNRVALSEQPKRVSAVAAVARDFQPSRRYVGTIEPWLQAKIGPQLVSAYVTTVLVRPGALVKKGDVIATLDCRNASAISRQVEAQAQALDAMSQAATIEASRVASLLDGKFVSENEVDKKKADAAAKIAQLTALRAQLASSSLQVDDCVLRSPFDGEIADRQVDPGAFVRPGTSIATLVDRQLVRVIGDVPEEDFQSVDPGRSVRLRLIAANRGLVAKISRRAPAVDPGTRTARIELDLEDPARSIPVWTTAELSIDVGRSVPATAIPITAAVTKGTRALVFVVANGIAKQTTVKVLGEQGGVLYVDPAGLAPNAAIVTQGRALLADGDAIAATMGPWSPDAETVAETKR